MDIEMTEKLTPRGFIRREIAAFWAWYERHYAINVTVATFLFGLQLIHLTWLSLHVIATRLTGTSYFPASGILLGALLIVDMLEIPALISVSLVYLNEFRQKRNIRSLLYLFMLNSQWVHILWITDEFVVNKLANLDRAWPVWLAWVAIGIDYLELPVMLDTAKRFLAAIAGKASLRDAFRESPTRRRRLSVTSVYCPAMSFSPVALPVVAQTNGGITVGNQPVSGDDPECCSNVAS